MESKTRFFSWLIWASLTSEAVGKTMFFRALARAVSENGYHMAVNAAGIYRRILQATCFYILVNIPCLWFNSYEEMNGILIIDWVWRPLRQ